MSQYIMSYNKQTVGRDKKERKVRRVELIVRVTKKLSLDLELVLHNNPAAAWFFYIVQ